MKNTNLTHHYPVQSTQPTQAMQWVGLILITFLTFSVLTAPIIAAYITKNIVYLAPTIGAIPLGTIWHRLAIFLYKKPEDYKLEALKTKRSILKRHVET